MSVLLRNSSAVLRTVRRGYRSDISLDKLYPGRETVRVTPPDLRAAKFTGHIPMTALTTSHDGTAVDIRSDHPLSPLFSLYFSSGLDST